MPAQLLNFPQQPQSQGKAGAVADRIRELLHYDPKVGVFRWRVPSGRFGRIKAGTIAGSLNVKMGYRQIRIDGKLHYAPRLAWLYMTGDWPAECIDHVNRQRSDDRWENLREATRAQNQHNRSKTHNNTSGFKGVSRFRNKWVAEITFDYKKHHLGNFRTAEEAHAAYCLAAKQLHGEFARNA